MENIKQRGLFMDLDHTLIRPKSGQTFPKDIDDWEFIIKNIGPIKHFVDMGYLPIIVSNQGDIEHGYQTRDETEMKFNIISRTLERQLNLSKDIIKYYFSASTWNNDPLRKPNDGMAILAEHDYSIDIINSIMVGDMESDQQFAKNSGIGKFIWAKDFSKY